MTDAVNVVHTWRERIATGDMARLAEVVDLTGYTETCLGLTGWTTGFETAMQNFVRNMVEPWSDMVMTDQEILTGPDAAAADGLSFDGHDVRATDAVVIRSRVEATHIGEFLGVAPTGRRIAWDTLTLVWVRDGRVVGQWAQPDLWGIHQQLTRG
jgi:predicted ester cyclase